MSYIGLFRILVALSFFLSLSRDAWEFLPIAMPDDWKTLLEWNGNGGVSEWLSQNLPHDKKPEVFGLVLFLSAMLGLLVYAQIGMFLFWRKARTAYVVVVVGFAILGFFDGLVVVLPGEAALGGLSLLVDGAVIAMAFLPPVRARFQKNTPNHTFNWSARKRHAGQRER